jgi:cysteine-rich repeat protein
MRGIASRIAALLVLASAAQADVAGRWRVEGEFFDVAIWSLSQTGTDVTVAGATVGGIPLDLAGSVTGDVLTLADVGFVCPVETPLRVLPGERLLAGRAAVGGACFPAAGSVVATRCTCFDGNADTGDGCDPQCQVEACWTCSGDPSVCTPIAEAAACDDRRDCTAGTTCTTGVCGGGTTVPACADLTGIWRTVFTSSYGYTVEQTADVVQEGGVIVLRYRPSGAAPLVGTIDVATGGLSLQRPNTTFYCSEGDGLVATAATDGNSFAGSMRFAHDTPRGTCLPDTGPLEAVRTDCGNGAVDPGEGCDDGNSESGDGCAIDCRVETCTPVPRAGCRVSRTPSRSTLKLRDRPGADHDDLGWRWKAGAATTPADFGQPTSDIALCFYAGDGAVPLLEAAVPAGGTCGARPCWRPTAKGFAYTNKAGTPQGVASIALVSGVDGKAKITVKGKGALLSLPAPPFDLPLRVQLQIENGACFETRHDATSVQRNVAGTFQARGVP